MSAAANEDWLRTRGWGFPGVGTVDELLAELGAATAAPPAQRAALGKFMTLPAWRPAPAGLKAEAKAFMGEGTASRRLGWAEAERWNPRLHPRDAHGEFASTPGSAPLKLPAGMLASPRLGMADVPEDDPLWARLDQRMGTAQHYGRGAQAGQVRRPAMPAYREAVGKVADEIVSTIRDEGTLEEGKGWYPAERKLAERRARAFGVTPEVAAAVESATSPRTSYETNQRVTDEILDAASHPGTRALLERSGGGVMGAPRRAAVAIALGADIGRTLTGKKRRAFYNNIAYPGQTDEVTVDTWMMQAIADGLGMTTGQAQQAGAETVKDFPSGLGVMLVSDATRRAAEELGAPVDAVQAGYWIAAQRKYAGQDPHKVQAGSPRPSGRRRFGAD